MIDSVRISNQLSINTTGVENTPRPEGDAPVERVSARDRGGVKDRVTISDRGREKTNGIKTESDLAPEERQQVNELKQRDAEVKAHERAHMAAGGGLVQGGASYQYQRGPDGKMYAVGGEVKIDVSSERTPEATIQKMEQVRRAALAPAQPSGTDRAVAAQAAQTEADARSQRTREDQEKQQRGEEDRLGMFSNPTVNPLGRRIDLSA